MIKPADDHRLSDAPSDFPVVLSIGIMAWNEEASIVPMLASLFEQSNLRPPRGPAGALRSRLPGESRFSMPETIPQNKKFYDACWSTNRKTLSGSNQGYAPNLRRWMTDELRDLPRSVCADQHPAVGEKRIGGAALMTSRQGGPCAPPRGRDRLKERSFEPYDRPASFHGAVDRLLNDPPRSPEWGAAGRAKVAAGYDTATLADRMRQIYRELLADKNAHRHSARR